MLWLNIPAQWLHQHLSEIALSITAMLLMVSGPYINAALKKLTGKFHWLLRYALFVLLATLGYGLVTNYCLSMTRKFMLSLGQWEIVSFVAGAHLLFAWLLKRDKAI